MPNHHPRRNPGTTDTTKSKADDASTSAPARTAQPADGGRVEADSGAPPSNTAPHKCKPDYFKALRWGVDSLYLSYSGELHPDSLTRLKALKAMAQAKDHPDQQALAQYPINGDVFEVKDKGASLFPYVLENGAFRIQLSKGGKVPMAYVKVSAAYLAHLGPQEAERRLYAILSTLGNLTSSAQVSRIDLFCDFVWTESMEWDRLSWITRAIGIDTYSENNTFTGWVIGRGGIMLGRLYNKLLQAAKVGGDYLIDLWHAAGRQPGEPVWRLEFQIKRDVLNQMGIVPLSSALNHLDGLWSYATTEWLRLAIPQESDQTRSRWPINPLWGHLSAIDWNGNGGPLLRSYDPARTPSDPKLYSMYLGTLVSYMAKRGLADPYAAQEALIAEVVGYYMGRVERDGLSFDDFLAERIALKVRVFGVGLNDPDGLDKLDQAQIDTAAKSYRKASRG